MDESLPEDVRRDAFEKAFAIHRQRSPRSDGELRRFTDWVKSVLEPGFPEGQLKAAVRSAALSLPASEARVFVIPLARFAINTAEGPGREAAIGALVDPKLRDLIRTVWRVQDANGAEEIKAAIVSIASDAGSVAEMYGLAPDLKFAINKKVDWIPGRLPTDWLPILSAAGADPKFAIEALARRYMGPPEDLISALGQLGLFSKDYGVNQVVEAIYFLHPSSEARAAAKALLDKKGVAWLALDQPDSNGAEVAWVGHAFAALAKLQHDPSLKERFMQLMGDLATDSKRPGPIRSQAASALLDIARSDNFGGGFPLELRVQALRLLKRSDISSDERVFVVLGKLYREANDPALREAVADVLSPEGARISSALAELSARGGKTVDPSAILATLSSADAKRSGFQSVRETAAFIAHLDGVPVPPEVDAKLASAIKAQTAMAYQRTRSVGRRYNNGRYWKYVPESDSETQAYARTVVRVEAALNDHDFVITELYKIRIEAAALAKKRGAAADLDPATEDVEAVFKARGKPAGFDKLVSLPEGRKLSPEEFAVYLRGGYAFIDPAFGNQAHGMYPHVVQLYIAMGIAEAEMKGFGGIKGYMKVLSRNLDDWDRVHDSLSPASGFSRPEALGSAIYDILGPNVESKRRVGASPGS
jgi:hypothetical protein